MTIVPSAATRGTPPPLQGKQCEQQWLHAMGWACLPGGNLAYQAVMGLGGPGGGPRFLAAQGAVIPTQQQHAAEHLSPPLHLWFSLSSVVPLSHLFFFQFHETIFTKRLHIRPAIFSHSGDTACSEGPCCIGHVSRWSRLRSLRCHLCYLRPCFSDAK